MKWKDKTCGGYPVRIYAEDGVGKYPIHGAINYGEGWVANTWTSDGEITASRVFSERDLIPATPIIDWSKQPDWCKAVAMDEDGLWCRFEMLPRASACMWLRGSAAGFCQPMHPSESPQFDGNWKESLCVRPEGGAK